MLHVKITITSFFLPRKSLQKRKRWK